MAEHYDLIIIGGGPAGLTSGIYGGRAKLKTLIINKGSIGGQVDTTREIVNYPGYSHTSGPELMADFKAHAEAFGVEFARGEVTEVDFSSVEKSVTTKRGKTYTASAVILACGNQPRLLNIPGEKELRGDGVSYCATCDAEFYEGDHVVVIGTGDQAIEEGMHITKFARQVTVVSIHEDGILDCNRLSAEKAYQNDKMDFICNSTVSEVLGENQVEGVRLKNLLTGETEDLACQGVFFFVGTVPSTGFLQNSGLELDGRGYIPTNDRMETNISGVYAVGDNRVKYLRQVVSAAGDGATAAVAAERYIEDMNDFRKEVLRSDLPTLLYFYHVQNQPSLDFAATLEEASKESGQDYKIVKEDMSNHNVIAEQYQVTDIPTVILVNQGKEVTRMTAVQTKEDILKILQS